MALQKRRRKGEGGLGRIKVCCVLCGCVVYKCNVLCVDLAQLCIEPPPQGMIQCLY